MKRVNLIFLFCLFGPLYGSIQVDLREPNSLSGYPSTEVMMGSQVAIVISSDANSIWSGSLFVEGWDRTAGVLQGRQKDPNSRNWMGSCFEASGDGALALHWKDSVRWGFDFYTDDCFSEPGKWFVVDYVPLKPGPCQVTFYDHSFSWSVADPNQTIIFYNTPTRDFNDDGIVNYADFAIFASHWLTVTGSDPNTFSPADLSMDGQVDLVDVLMFSDYWLHGVPGWTPRPPAVKTPAAPVVDTVFYSIVDAEGLSEITMAVGQSRTFYITQTAFENTYVFAVEAYPSDPNLGWIDNTPIDGNNPPGPGTARILFEPRDTFFDDWGYGWENEDGISFVAASLWSAIQDGLMASFVYTAEQEGTVTLNLLDHCGYLSAMEPITIHQVNAENTMLSMSEPEQVTQQDLLETVEMLEELWDSDPEIRQQIDEENWNEFIESVKTSIELNEENLY